MRSYDIANEMNRTLIENKITSVWVPDTNLYYWKLNAEDLDFTITVVCASYTGNDADKMVTKKQVGILERVSNVAINGDITDITKVAGINLIKFALRFPYQKFSVIVQKRK